MKIFTLKNLLLLITLTAATTPSYAATQSFDFTRITNNNIEDVASQLSLTVWDSAMANSNFNLSLDTDEILFTVMNNVGIASSVSEIYFDDGLLGPSLVVNDLGGNTNFNGGGANPGNLPGGNDPAVNFIATQEFSADAQGNPNNGVNASNDIVGIILGLGSFSDFNAVINAANSGDLRFGLHVRSIGSAGGSDSFVNTTVVPLPAAVWLLGSALIGLIGIKKRNNSF